jgi:hypothetical protein
MHNSYVYRVVGPQWRSEPAHAAHIRQWRCVISEQDNAGGRSRDELESGHVSFLEQEVQNVGAE